MLSIKGCTGASLSDKQQQHKDTINNITTTAINSSVESQTQHKNTYIVYNVLLQDTSSPGNSAPQHHLWKKLVNRLFYAANY